MNGKSNIERLTGVDSDIAPFLQHVGVPSVDIYYGRDFLAFDSFHWVINYADPFFWRHVAFTLSMIQLDYLSYAKQLQDWIELDFFPGISDAIGMSGSERNNSA
ncbi:hypothetical protein V6N12_050531 [Hibiscus sabdariffa]|uniref:Uncharacterized protein n=1 Tax=Hibiscus sabdariffa TaxID=183260 RepID=A0ABR2GCU1_9ROSI